MVSLFIYISSSEYSPSHRYSGGRPLPLFRQPSWVPVAVLATVQRGGSSALLVVGDSSVACPMLVRALSLSPTTIGLASRTIQVSRLVDTISGLGRTYWNIID